MKKYYYHNLPEGLKQPLSFREKGGDFEGVVESPWEVIELFEPVDTLSGNIEIVDAVGRVMQLGTDDKLMVENNEYGELSRLFIVET